MAFSGFVRKVWQDRVSEFPLRRRLTDTTSGVSQQVTVARDEGTVTTQGDTFDAANMNGLEARIASSFTEDEAAIGNLANLTTTEKTNLVGAVNEVKASVPTFVPESLGDLDNVQLSTSGIPTGSVLSFDGSNSTWINKELPASDVKFTASQIVQSTNVQNAIDFIAGEMDAMQTEIEGYHPGDTIQLKNGMYTGQISNSGKTFTFWIPLNKPISSDVSSVTVSDMKGDIYGANKKLVSNTQMSTIGTISNPTITALGIRFAIVMTTAPSGVINDTIASLYVYNQSPQGTITFN